MKLENFDEWFAIRSDHKDDDHWPGRLTFSLDDGISLTTVKFIDSSASYPCPKFESGTITGWLDYQKPATLIGPWLQSSYGHTWSIDTPAQRVSYRIVANAILKNVFLENINEEIFTGLKVNHPALHAWVNPDLVSVDRSQSSETGQIRQGIELADPISRTFLLGDGTEAVVVSYAQISNDAKISIQDQTTLQLKLPHPINHDAITRIMWRITSFFSFLIGARITAPVYLLPTTQMRSWNGEQQYVTAEYWYRPAQKGKDLLPKKRERMLIDGQSSLTTEKALEILAGGRDELIYLAEVVQSVEKHELPIAQGFGELLGCLEDFDRRSFGSGAEPDFKANLKSLEQVVKGHGSDSDQALFGKIKSVAPNSFSLLLRLQRLHTCWEQDGFLGNPDLRRVKELRNLVPHGRGIEVSSQIAQEMIEFNSYLTALGRFHILKALGCTGQEVARAFSTQPHLYGRFLSRNNEQNNP